jgi:ammonium transporter Rh
VEGSHQERKSLGKMVDTNLNEDSPLLDNGTDDKSVESEDDDNMLDFGKFAASLQIVFFLLYALFVRYDDGPAGINPDASSAEIIGKYSQFQDVHVMIFIGFGMLMLFLKKYAYSSISYTLLVAIVVIQWHILVDGFFENSFAGEWGMIKVSLTNLILADFASAVVLITFGACLGKVTKPSQLLVIALLEIVFFSINEEIGKKLHVADLGGSMVVHVFGAYFGLGVSYVLTTPEARSHPDNSAEYTSDIFAMIGSIFLWMFWPSFNSALASEYDQERTVINTVLALTASGLAAFAFSYLLRGEKKFDMVDVQNASIAGGVAVGTTSNMMLGPAGAQIIGFLAGLLSVTGYVYIQPYLEKKIGLYDTCGVHNLHGMPGVLAGIASIIFAGVATIENYNSKENFLAVFPHNEDPGTQACIQAAFLVLTLVVSTSSGLITGIVSKKVCGTLQPRVYNDDQFFELP